MADRVQLARLRITPSGGMFPLPVHTVILAKQGQQYRVETIEQRGRARKTWRIEIPATEVAEKFQRLKLATVPAFPVSPLVCDGEYVELTINGEYSTLTLGWWTIAPEGAETLSDFADWLRALGLPSQDDDNE